MRSAFAVLTVAVVVSSVLLTDDVGQHNQRLASKYKYSSRHRIGKPRFFKAPIDEFLIRPKRGPVKDQQEAVTKEQLDKGSGNGKSVNEPVEEKKEKTVASVNGPTTEKPITKAQEASPLPKEVKPTVADVPETTKGKSVGIYEGKGKEEDEVGSSSTQLIDTTTKEKSSFADVVLTVFIVLLLVGIIIVNIVNVVICMKNKGKCGGSKSGESTKYKSKAAVNAKKTQKAGQKTASKAKSESRARGGAETFPGKDQLLPYCMSMNPRDYMRYGAAGHPNYPMIKNSDQLMEGLCRELTGDQKFYDESTVEQELEETSTVSSDALHLDLRGFQNLKIL